jgi:uncharacterized protein
MKTLVCLSVAAGLVTAQPQAPAKKRVLAIGAVAGYQHDETTDALALIWRLGRDTGLWDTFIRTDTQLITKKKLASNAKTLDYFDAIVFYTTGELPLDEEQKASLLSFVHDDGKGFVGIHSAIDTFFTWPEFAVLTGAWFDQHPWGQFQAPIIVEDPNFPAMRAFPREFVIHDEIYQASKEFSRDKVRVLARLDESKINLNQKGVNRTDKDFAVAWVKNYGKGRVFYSTFGHRQDALDRGDVQAMYREAVKWAMRLVDGDATPRRRP